MTNSCEKHTPTEHWFSCLLRLLARKRSGLILTAPEPGTGPVELEQKPPLRQNPS